MIDRAKIAGITAATCLCLSLIASLPADDPLPTTDDDPPAAPRASKEPEATNESVEPKPRDPLDQKLKKSLDPAGNEEIERIEKAIEGMRAAGRRIEARDTGAETLRVQRQVIEDLKQLLELLKQRKRDQQKQPNPKPDQNQNQDQNQQQNQSSDPRSGQQSANSTAPKPTPQQSEAEKSREAREREEAARRGAADEERQKMIKDVWGHLPPHLREAMLNSFSEKYLPKYEDLVKKYYEALAERNRKRSAK